MASAQADRVGASIRCHCGNLLARLVPDGVEIKCRRCKRTVVIPVDKGGTSASHPELRRGKLN